MGRFLDLSNYSEGFTTENAQALKNDGLEGVIIQAFPPSYHQYTIQRVQMRVARDVGLRQAAYLYDYLASPSWFAGCLQGLAQAEQEDQIKPERLWLDEEDVSPEAQRMSEQQRADAIDASFAAADQYTSDHGLQARPGLYTGYWWLDQYVPNLAHWQDRAAWLSDYDGNPDPTSVPLRYGWTRITMKQYAGSTNVGPVGGVDLDYLSDDEETPPVTTEDTQDQTTTSTRETPEDWPWATWREAAINFKSIADTLGQNLAQAQQQIADQQQLQQQRGVANLDNLSADMHSMAASLQQIASLSKPAEPNQGAPQGTTQGGQ